ncbi:hypothetical protein NLI96_g11797 [Meripilus lineatus]|uniref:Uncharacterized protein n=1 Tax=Meripilus lineatus TaxID=2056292 RepID=A0AAD5UR42_9APHY|nr:hypothetical protein NLI96_g11797 [Physisporinus lineatus]
MAIFLTVRRSMRIRESLLMTQGNFRVTEFLVQDGSVLIGILLLINVAQSIIVLISPIDYLFILSWEVSCMLQCHWIFELRQVHLTDNTTTLGSASSVRFATRIIGNVGAPLRHPGLTIETDSVDEEETIIYSSDPLSAMSVPETPVVSRLLPKRQTSVDIDIDDLFEDEEYGKKVLGIIRRKGTTDTIDYHIVSLDAIPEERTTLADSEDDSDGSERRLIP